MVEDPLVVALESGAAAVLPQLLDEAGGERDRADTLLGLRVADAQDALGERDVAPTEPDELMPAQARQDERQERRAVLVIGELAGDTGDLDGLEDAPTAT